MYVSVHIIIIIITFILPSTFPQQQQQQSYLPCMFCPSRFSPNVFLCLSALTTTITFVSFLPL